MLSATARLENNISMFDRIPVIHGSRPATPGGSFVGQFFWNGSGFNSFCVEGQQSISPGLHTFPTVKSLATSGLANAGLVADFWRRYGPTTPSGFSSVTDAAAFQLGLWEIISDGRPAAGQAAAALAGGSFNVGGSASPAVARAASWLNGTGAPAPGAGGSVDLHVMQHPTLQDQVIWGPLPPPSVSVKVTPTTGVTEDGPNALTYEFTASPAPTADITVNYRIGGSAAAASDFTTVLPPGATTGTITIRAGSTSPVTLRVVPKADTEIERDETVVITLQNGTGYAPGTSVATGTILNDDFFVDLDVDSNNDGTIDPDNGPEGTDDPIEDATGKPGVIVPVGGRAQIIVYVPQGQTGTLAYDAAAASKVRVLTPSGAVVIDQRQLSTTVGGGSPQTFWIEAIAPSESMADIAFTLTLDVNPGSGSTRTASSGSTPSDTVRVSAVVEDLIASTIERNAVSGELSQELEDSLGAYLPVNNDDDDWDGTLDNSAATVVDGENDLLPVKLRVSKAVTSKVRVSATAGAVFLFKKNERGEQGSQTFLEFDAAELQADPGVANVLQTTFYVAGKTKGSRTLKLAIDPHGDGGWRESDTIRVNVFDWSGPLNVPDYSVYSYRTENALPTSKWITPVGGTIESGANTSVVNIFWGEGAVVGKAIYQVNEDYMWDKEVNVVRVKLGTTNRIAYEAGPIHVPGTLIIKSAHPGPAMKAELDIEIDGPIIGGSMRGVKFIEAGFTQTILPKKWHADYDQLPKIGEPGLGRRMTSSMENTVFLDTIRGSTRPWYDTHDEGVPDANGLEDNLPDKTRRATLKTGDTPALPGTSHYRLFEKGVFDEVDLFSMIFDFEICLSVRTTDTSNDAEKVFTKRACADWSFDGTGTVAVVNGGTWTLRGKGNSGDASFAEVTDGSRLTDERRVFNTVFDHHVNNDSLWRIANQ